MFERDKETVVTIVPEWFKKYTSWHGTQSFSFSLYNEKGITPWIKKDYPCHLALVKYQPTKIAKIAGNMLIALITRFYYTWGIITLFLSILWVDLNPVTRNSVDFLSRFPSTTKGLSKLPVKKVSIWEFYHYPVVGNSNCILYPYASSILFTFHGKNYCQILFTL